MSLNKMKSIVREQLVIIDEILSKREKPLTLRPLEAAIIFVNEVIVEIKGEDKNDFHEKKWFAEIYKWTDEWYQERYGEAIKNSHDNTSKGIAIVYGTPFSLIVPMTLSEPEEPGKTSWLIFPNSIFPEEKILDWLQPKPNLEQLTEQQLATLKEEIEYVGVCLRSIRINIMSAEYVNASLQMLGGSISAHFEKSVQDILSGKREQLTVSFWEMHLAIEKAIKLFLKQNKLACPKTHDLIRLREISNQKIETDELNYSFSICPTEKDSIKYRYGEMQDVSVEKAYILYKEALKIVAFYTKALYRKITMENARFLLQLPPWQKKA